MYHIIRSLKYMVSPSMVQARLQFHFSAFPLVLICSLCLFCPQAISHSGHLTATAVSVLASRYNSVQRHKRGHLSLMCLLGAKPEKNSQKSFLALNNFSINIDKNILMLKLVTGKELVYIIQIIGLVSTQEKPAPLARKAAGLS